MRRLFPLLLLFVVGVAFTFARPAAQSAAPAKPQAAVGVQQPAAAAVVRPKMPMLAGVDPALLKGLHYRLVGPSRGGRVTAGDRRAVAAADLLHGRRQRRRVQDHRQRRDAGRRSPTARSRSARSARSRSPTRTRTSSTSAPARTACAATSRPGAASTSRTDAGETWTFAGLYDAGQIGGVRIHPTNPDIVWVAAIGDMRSSRTPSAASSRRPTAARRGRRRSTSPTQLGAMDVEFQPGNPERRLRVDVAPRAQAVDDHQRRRARAASTRAPNGGDVVREDLDRPARTS